MKLLKHSNKMAQVLGQNGLVQCQMEYEIKSASANSKWTGPKIDVQTWSMVLAFLKHVYEETKSESQVRLYVNTEEQRWCAWAYPQEAKTGMSAKEISNDAASEQRARFNGKWKYAGTVHSHCSASAFQSGTDEHNEQSQDGLHITIGNLDKQCYDIHCRFYLSGNKFDPDMTDFWDVGDEMLQKALELEQFFGVVPNLDRLARRQMCTPPGKDYPFPQQWKDNIIEIKSVHVSCGWEWSEGMSGYSEYTPSPTYNGSWKSAKKVGHRYINTDFDFKKVKECLEKLDYYKNRKMEWREIMVDLAMSLESFNDDPGLTIITYLLKECDVDIEGLDEFFYKEQEKVIAAKQGALPATEDNGKKEKKGNKK